MTAARHRDTKTQSVILRPALCFLFFCRLRFWIFRVYIPHNFVAKILKLTYRSLNSVNVAHHSNFAIRRSYSDTGCTGTQNALQKVKVKTAKVTDEKTGNRQPFVLESTKQFIDNVHLFLSLGIFSSVLQLGWWWRASSLGARPLSPESAGSRTEIGRDCLLGGFRSRSHHLRKYPGY